MAVRSAAVRGIDFGRARPREKNWWRYVNLVTNARAAADDLETFLLAHRHHCALVANGNLTPESFEEVQKQAAEAFTHAFNLLQPWAKTTPTEIDSGEKTRMIDAYHKAFGTDSPEWQEKMKALMAAHGYGG
jgi:hypothetical protein